MKCKQLSQESQSRLDEARALAESLGHHQIRTEHLLLALLEPPTGIIISLFRQCQVDLPETAMQVRSLLESSQPPSTQTTPVYLSAPLRNVLGGAFIEAGRMEDEEVYPEHLLIAMSETDAGEVARILRRAGFSGDSIVEALPHLPRMSRDTGPGSRGRVQRRKPIKMLEMFGRNLTDADFSTDLNLAIGRELEIEAVIQALLRPTRNNPLIVGEPESGKAAIVHGLAQRIVDEEVPDEMGDRRLVLLDMAELVNGASGLAELKARLRALLAETAAYPGKIILVLNELSTFVGDDNPEGKLAEVSNALNTLLRDGELRCIGMTTPTHYRESIEPDESLDRFFQIIPVAPATEQDGAALFHRLEERYRRLHGVQIPESAIAAAAALSARYIGGHSVPRPVLDALDEAESRLRLKISSLPTEIDKDGREALQWEIEAAAHPQEDAPD